MIVLLENTRKFFFYKKTFLKKNIKQNLKNIFKKLKNYWSLFLEKHLIYDSIKNNSLKNTFIKSTFNKNTAKCNLNIDYHYFCFKNSWGRSKKILGRKTFCSEWKAHFIMYNCFFRISYWVLWWIFNTFSLITKLILCHYSSKRHYIPTQSSLITIPLLDQNAE